MSWKAVPKEKQDVSVITIPAHTVPTTWTQHGYLIGTAVRQEENCDANTPTTLTPMTSAHTETSKDTCWELQHKQPSLWTVSKT